MLASGAATVEPLQAHGFEADHSLPVLIAAPGRDRLPDRARLLVGGHHAGVPKPCQISRSWRGGRSGRGTRPAVGVARRCEGETEALMDTRSAGRPTCIQAASCGLQLRWRGDGQTRNDSTLRDIHALDSEKPKVVGFLGRRVLSNDSARRQGMCRAFASAPNPRRPRVTISSTTMPSRYAMPIAASAAPCAIEDCRRR